jgi:hypothetical protein
MGTKRSRWWWPYFHPVVTSYTMLLILFSVVIGSATAVVSTVRGTHLPWVDWTKSVNVEYDFAWSELTEGEGSLFWIIASNGFEPDPKNIAKFPLYPAIVRAIWEVTEHQFSIAFILWCVHTLMAWAGLAELFRFWEDYHPGFGIRAINWVLFSPLFMLHLWVASYVEPGFVALFWACLSLERRKQWAWSGALMSMLVLLQPSGIFLAGPLVIRRLYQLTKKEVKPVAVIWAFLPIYMWLGWIVITSIGWDRPFAPYTYQEEWGRTVWRWPWDRWYRFFSWAADRGTVGIQHIFTTISVYWIVVGFAKGGKLFAQIGSQKRDLFLGAWVMPVFSVLLIVVPFATYVFGANRYAVCSLISVWPLLYSIEAQESARFRKYEKLIWIFGAIGSLIIIFAFVTGLCDDWRLYF